MYRSEKEPFIRLKYVSHAFVHPHPDFVRPDVPLPPRKIQGTLLRSVATSPKLAGKINRPMSMATGIEATNGNGNRSPLSSFGLPSGPTEKVSGEGSERMGGVKSENLALLEANLKKLEKTGKLHQWNKRLNSVVKRSPSPKKHFSFTRFARPSSFRRKKSPLVGDDRCYSDNELEVGTLLSISSASSSPITPHPPKKPPRTYVTKMKDMEDREEEEEDTERLFTQDDESFSSDLLNTFQKLGSMYNMNVILDDPAHEPNEVGMDHLSPEQPKRVSIQRSLSAMGAIDSPPSISVTNCSPSPPLNSLPPVTELSLLKNLSYSDTSLDVHCSEDQDASILDEEDENIDSEEKTDKNSSYDDDANTKDPNRDEETKETSIHVEEKEVELLKEDGNEADDMGNVSEELFNTELPPPQPHRQWREEDELSDLQEEPDEGDTASLSSQDSFQSAMDFGRPESVASELFHTPPRSLSPDDETSPDLEAAEDHTVSMGRSLGIHVHVTLGEEGNEEGGEEGKGEEERKGEEEKEVRTRNMSTITITGDEIEFDNMKTLTRPKKNNLTVEEEEGGATTEEEELDIGEGPREGEDKVGGVNGEVGVANEVEDDSNEIHSSTEDDFIIIPDSMSPTKVSVNIFFIFGLLFLFTQYIFECSLSGDIPGILCGLCHGGSLSEQDPVEGQRYPVHQACITVRYSVHVHTCILMLCSKFEVIPTSIFRVTVILKNEPKSEKIPVL